MDYYIQQPHPLDFREERRLLLCFHASFSLFLFPSSLLKYPVAPLYPTEASDHSSSYSHPAALSISCPACCTLTKKPNQNMLLQNYAPHQLPCSGTILRTSDCDRNWSLLRVCMSIPSPEKDTTTGRVWVAHTGMKKVKNWRWTSTPKYQK